VSRSSNGSDGADLLPAESEGAAASDTAAWFNEFEQLVARVEAAADEWGVESGSVEGRFVSALLGTTRWLGRLCLAAQARAETAARETREAAERELAQATEMRRAAEVSLRQARTAFISLEVEKENLTVKMIRETLPLFAERLKEVLVIRECRWNDDIKRRRLATAGAVALGLVFVGYGIHVWQSSEATSTQTWCLWNQLQANGHTFCDLTIFKQSHQ
jgi:hypothetical protein